MGAEQQNKLMYVVMCVFEYARRQHLSVPESMHTLLDCGGISFLDEYYDIEHTLPLDDTIDALAAISSRKSGATA